jgi:hypothetical protein
VFFSKIVHVPYYSGRFHKKVVNSIKRFFFLWNSVKFLILVFGYLYALYEVGELYLKMILNIEGAEERLVHSKLYQRKKRITVYRFKFIERTCIDSCTVWYDSHLFPLAGLSVLRCSTSSFTVDSSNHVNVDMITSERLTATSHCLHRLCYMWAQWQWCIFHQLSVCYWSLCYAVAVPK